MADISISKILESESYKHQKEVVSKAINKNVHPSKFDGTVYAPARIADLRRVMSVDVSTFKKTNKEKGELITLKKAFRKKMKAKHPDWTKRNSTKPEYIQFNMKSIW